MKSSIGLDPENPTAFGTNADASSGQLLGVTAEFARAAKSMKLLALTTNGTICHAARRNPMIRPAALTATPAMIFLALRLSVTVR